MQSPVSKKNCIMPGTAVTWGNSPSSIRKVITRRQAIRNGFGFAGALAALPLGAFAVKEFWNEKKTADWTDAEIHQLLNKSPWAKEGSISDTARRGSLSSAPAEAAGARPPSVRTLSTTGHAPASGGPLVEWKATVRWESALPIREALHRGAPGQVPDDYILNVFGELPGIETVLLDGSWKDNTRLEHKGDFIKVNRVEPAPKSSESEDGTLFYFSRLLALELGDKEVTFTTKMGPLVVKCKFALRDMVYRGNLEL